MKEDFSKRIFVIDAATWIKLYEEMYPPDVFPALYEALKVLAFEGRITSPAEVERELGADGKGTVRGFVKALGIAMPHDPQIPPLAAAIKKAHPTLLKKGATADADPWLVAIGQHLGHVVVTDEKPSTSPTKEKIPNVCISRGVSWTSGLDMLRHLRVRICATCNPLSPQT